MVAIHNKNGQGLLQQIGFLVRGYAVVAIHNKNGQGLLHEIVVDKLVILHTVAIHNKNGQGLLPFLIVAITWNVPRRNPQ